MVESGIAEFRWPVSARCVIGVPANTLWETIATPGILESCHPFCASNPVSSWPGSESRDEVHYLSGWKYERRFRKWVDGVGFDLDIASRGEIIASVAWRIQAIDDNSSVLQISVRPYALQHLPVFVRWLPHLVRIRPRLKSYLRSVVKGFRWYLTRGEPVPREAFGRHPWFSAHRSRSTG